MFHLGTKDQDATVDFVCGCKYVMILKDHSGGDAGSSGVPTLMTISRFVLLTTITQSKKIISQINLFLNMQACTFVEWIDNRPNPDGLRPRELESKSQYLSRMQEARESKRQARLEQERRVRQEQIRLKGKEDELQRRRATLGGREAALKRQEDEFEAREARLRQTEESRKARNNEAGQPSSERARKGKYPRCTQ